VVATVAKPAIDEMKKTGLEIGRLTTRTALL